MNNNILIVDDEMDLRMLLEKRFTAEGYSVTAAYNGCNALALAKTYPPDIVVLDRILGDMSGEEVAEKLRKHQNTKNVPVIFMSALLETNEMPAIDNSIAITKPFDADELLAAVAKMLNKKS